MPNITVGPAVLTHEEDDENAKVELSFSYTYENKEALDFTEISAILRRSDGVFIADATSTISDCGTPGVEKTESIGFYWLNKKLIPADKSTLDVLTTIKLGEIKKITEFNLEIDEKRSEMPIAFDNKKYGGLEIIGGSINIDEPDEEKCVNLNLVICVKNHDDRYYPEFKVMYELTGFKEDFIDGDDGVMEIKPLSYTYFNRTMYIKKSKLKKSKLNGSIQLSDYVIVKCV